MKWLIDDLYEMIEFDYYDFDLFDCMWLLRRQESLSISFFHKDTPLTIKAIVENGELTIHWFDDVYPDRDEFFTKAMLGDQRLISLQDELYGFEVL